jgi:hypothetical protein
MERRQSKKLKDLGDIARLVESHPQLWDSLDTELKAIIKKQLDLFVGEKYGRDRDR